MEQSTEALAAQVKELTLLVQKHSLIIAKTGKQLMELQLKDVKSRMALLDEKPQKVDTEDFVTNEDIIQLVGELQGQLDFLEDRTIKRAYNSAVTSSSEPTDKIAPLCNRDGDPAPEYYPATVGKLLAISPEDLLRLCEFYELIMENQANPELEAIIKSNDELTPEDAQKLFGAGGNEATIEQKLELFTKEDLDELFDEFARYIGVRIRKGDGW